MTQETIRKMFTKHLGDWGLGVQLQGQRDSLIFRHGGKNVGFTNEMIAYANLGRAVIVMTKRDRGNGLIREIIQSVSDTYQWNLVSPSVIDTIQL